MQWSLSDWITLTLSTWFYPDSDLEITASAKCGSMHADGIISADVHSSGLHWLPIEYQILFKVMVITFEALNNQGLTYTYWGEICTPTKARTFLALTPTWWKELPFQGLEGPNTVPQGM